MAHSVISQALTSVCALNVSGCTTSNILISQQLYYHLTVELNLYDCRFNVIGIGIEL